MIALVGINNRDDLESAREILEYGRLTLQLEDDVISPQLRSQLARRSRPINSYRYITNGDGTKTYVREAQPDDINATLSRMVEGYITARIKMARQEQCPEF